MTDLEYMAGVVDRADGSDWVSTLAESVPNEDQVLLYLWADAYEHEGRDIEAAIVRHVAKNNYWPLASKENDPYRGIPGKYMWYHLSTDTVRKLTYEVPQAIMHKVPRRWPGSYFSVQYETRLEAFLGLIQAIKEVGLERLISDVVTTKEEVQ